MIDQNILAIYCRYLALLTSDRLFNRLFYMGSYLLYNPERSTCLPIFVVAGITLVSTEVVNIPAHNIDHDIIGEEIDHTAHWHCQFWASYLTRIAAMVTFGSYSGTVGCRAKGDTPHPSITIGSSYQCAATLPFPAQHPKENASFSAAGKKTVLQMCRHQTPVTPARDLHSCALHRHHYYGAIGPGLVATTWCGGVAQSLSTTLSQKTQRSAIKCCLCAPASHEEQTESATGQGQGKSEGGRKGCEEYIKVYKVFKGGMKCQVNSLAEYSYIKTEHVSSNIEKTECVNLDDVPTIEGASVFTTCKLSHGLRGCITVWGYEQHEPCEISREKQAYVRRFLPTTKPSDGPDPITPMLAHHSALRQRSGRQE
ncbi:hypothetical protein P691DRAFT_785492 [Macrolepiota fuliginosa MF-IS2]|uniref:Uncharacterized protein n=1 Tax=Macrolepiota fuliginosa MF-IS2 TaxID=1400762 RepID=A0A9P5X7S6_9AGAR|nr:hypothetical protein P691DRAFT_785492 [Macrolepiota fuliginosa MF-IS2]